MTVWHISLPNKTWSMPREWFLVTWTPRLPCERSDLASNRRSQSFRLTGTHSDVAPTKISWQISNSKFPVQVCNKLGRIYCSHFLKSSNIQQANFTSHPVFRNNGRTLGSSPRWHFVLFQMMFWGSNWRNFQLSGARCVLSQWFWVRDISHHLTPFSHFKMNIQPTFSGTKRARLSPSLSWYCHSSSDKVSLLVHQPGCWKDHNKYRQLTAPGLPAGDKFIFWFFGVWNLVLKMDPFRDINF